MGAVKDLRCQAESCYERGDLEGALGIYQQLVRVSPTDADLLSDMGTVLFALGELEQSCGCYVRALELDADAPEALHNLRMVCRASGASLESVLRRRTDARLAEGRSREHVSADETGQVICPCCGGRFTQFLPAGWRKRPNRQCPGCGSRERHRALWLYLLNRTDIATTKLRVLHFSPMHVLRELLSSLPNLQYITSDLTARDVSLNMDITDLLLKDESVDVVLCVHVLEHVRDDRRAMSEILRVLKPGGWAIMQTPVDRSRQHTLEDPAVTDPRERERLFGQHDHVRSYGRDYWERLERTGFRVTVDDYLRRLGPQVQRRHQLGDDLDVCLCTKPLQAV